MSQDERREPKIDVSIGDPNAAVFRDHFEKEIRNELLAAFQQEVTRDFNTLRVSIDHLKDPNDCDQMGNFLKAAQAFDAAWAAFSEAVLSLGEIHALHNHPDAFQEYLKRSQQGIDIHSILAALFGKRHG